MQAVTCRYADKQAGYGCSAMESPTKHLDHCTSMAALVMSRTSQAYVLLHTHVGTKEGYIRGTLVSR